MTGIGILMAVSPSLPPSGAQGNAERLLFMAVFAERRMETKLSFCSEHPDEPGPGIMTVVLLNYYEPLPYLQPQPLYRGLVIYDVKCFVLKLPSQRGEGEKREGMQ